jgi:alpha-glucosidase
VVSDAVLRLRHRGTLPTGPDRSWAVVNPRGTVGEVAVGSVDGRFALCTSALSIVVDGQLRVVVTDAAGQVVVEDGPGGGYIEEPATGLRRLRRAATPTERFYGLGERTGTSLDKRGGLYTFWNTDAYVADHGGYPPDADPLYQAIPFLLGLRDGRAYGLFTDNPFRMELDLCRNSSESFVFSALAGPMDQYVVAGPALSSVVERYTELTGRMPLPPRWSLGYHQSRWGYADQARVREVVQSFRDRGLPADAIWLDIQHMDGFRSFTWDPVAYGDAAGLVSFSRERGFRTVTIVDPGIKQDGAWDIYQQGISGDHFLKHPDGTPYVGEVWPGPSCFPDFSRALTRQWWATLVARSTSLGVRGLWIDMNEPSDMSPGGSGTVPNDLLVDGDGFPTTMAEGHNVYGLNMARATHDALRAALPEERPFVLTRAGYASGQRFAAVWTGDAPSTWPTLQGTLPMMLNMGLSGLAFVGSDVGGYSGNPGAELFARWMELGSISPFFRGHVTRDVPDQEPWAFGVEVEYISRTVMTERYRLLPYLYSLFEESSRTGAPVLRPLVYEFQGDDASATVADQAMVGPWLLYAPVTTQGQVTRSLYLPPGRWHEYRSGAMVDGPTRVEVDLRLEALPAFVREGAILPHGPAMAHTGAAPLDPLQLDVYPSPGRTSWTLYEDEGDSFRYQGGAFRRTTYSAQATTTGSSVEAAPPEGTFSPPSRALVVRVRRVDTVPTAVTLDDNPLLERGSLDELLANRVGWWWDAADLSAWVAFTDRAPFTLMVSHARPVAVEAPTVAVPLEVVVPAGTPPGSTIHVATSANGWQQQPLSGVDGQSRARGTVVVPRGRWFDYKYTRGDWSTVEKWGGCLEATNRYALGAAHPGKHDRVDTWADQCP